MSALSATNTLLQRSGKTSAHNSADNLTSRSDSSSAKRSASDALTTHTAPNLTTTHSSTLLCSACNTPASMVLTNNGVKMCPDCWNKRFIKKELN